MIDLFVRDGLEVCAGVRQVLEDYAGQHPEYRVLEDSFMAIRQAIGLPKGNRARVNAVDATLAAMKNSGFIARSLATHGHSPNLQAS
jgi:polar amino acid transport system substrate-binding protein